MWLQKNKNLPEQGRVGRQARGAAKSPTFSYYTARQSDAPTTRLMDRGGDTPSVQKQGSIRWKSQLPLWILLAVAVASIVKVMTLTTLPKVVVYGQNATTSHYLQAPSVYATAAHKLLGSSLTNRNKLTANLHSNASALKAQFPELRTVSFGTALVSSRPILYIEAAQPSVVLQTTNGNYALNSSGVVLAKLQSLPSGVPQVLDQSGTRPHPGRQFLPGSTVAFMQTTAYQLSAAHLTLSTFVLPANSPYELDARLEGQQYLLRYNLAADALTQSGAAVASLQQLASSAPSSYLDVRVPGRVYYK